MYVGSGNGLKLSKWQAITCNNADSVHWGIYASIIVIMLTH